MTALDAVAEEANVPGPDFLTRMTNASVVIVAPACACGIVKFLFFFQQDQAQQ